MVTKYVRKDKVLRDSFHAKEQAYIAYKYLSSNLSLPFRVRKKAFQCLFYYTGGSKVKIKNKCVVTDRSRSILSHYKVSRLTFRKYAAQGLFNGIRKSSW